MEGSTRNVVLACEVCGERTVLGGPFSVWCSEGTTFGCECGEELTLAARVERGSGVIELIRGPAFLDGR